MAGQAQCKGQSVSVPRWQIGWKSELERCHWWMQCPGAAAGQPGPPAMHVIMGSQRETGAALLAEHLVGALKELVCSSTSGWPARP